VLTCVSFVAIEYLRKLSCGRTDKPKSLTLFNFRWKVLKLHKYEQQQQKLQFQNLSIDSVTRHMKQIYENLEGRGFLIRYRQQL
jgi:hypothetical protein